MNWELFQGWEHRTHSLRGCARHWGQSSSVLVRRSSSPGMGQEPQLLLTWHTSQPGLVAMVQRLFPRNSVNATEPWLGSLPW